jgi:uncharacterized membrane protein HdeD (DUF308 family)
MATCRGESRCRTESSSVSACGDHCRREPYSEDSSEPSSTRRRACRAFSSRRVGPVLGYLLLAVISVAAAVAALAWPGITVLVATVWIAVWAAVSGFTDLFLAITPRERAGERLMWALTGIISLIFAFVLAVRPEAGAVALATVWGFFSIFYGIMSITQAAQHPQESAV